MVNDAWKTSVGTERGFRVKANHAMFPLPHKIQMDVKCSQAGQIKSRMSAPLDQFHHVGRRFMLLPRKGRASSVLTSALSQDPKDRDLSPSHHPLLSACSCTDAARGQSLCADHICLALKRLCSPVGTSARWPSTSVCRSVATLALKIPCLESTVFMILI